MTGVQIIPCSKALTVSKCHHCGCPIDPDDEDDGMVIGDVFYCDNCAVDVIEFVTDRKENSDD